MAAAGGAVWLVLLTGVFFGSLRLSILDLLFLLGPLVVVPLALNLLPTTRVTYLSYVNGSITRFLLLPGAGLTTASFFLREGRVAGALVCVWLIVALALALDGLERLITTRLRSFPGFCFAIGEGYALVGSLWLLASRLGMQPVGFHEPIVLLTAVHFHYAGLMAAVLAGLAQVRDQAAGATMPVEPQPPTITKTEEARREGSVRPKEDSGEEHVGAGAVADLGEEVLLGYPVVAEACRLGRLGLGDRVVVGAQFGLLLPGAHGTILPVDFSLAMLPRRRGRGYGSSATARASSLPPAVVVKSGR